MKSTAYLFIRSLLLLIGCAGAAVAVFLLLLLIPGDHPWQMVGPNVLHKFVTRQGQSRAFSAPQGFHHEEVLSGLDSPASLRFAPDGRMFIGERISGQLLIAKQTANDDGWALNAQPFYVFDTPKDEDGLAQGHRSAGLRDFVFDPDFAHNGYLYVYYMAHATRQNRLVRLQVSADNPDVAAPASETLLFEMPFNDSISSGSHNGGALEFGSDGKLYVTTGDGWSGGDPVQSLSTFTGKVFRLNSDGSIPTDNPFYEQAVGPYRAIYALGLRNPYSLSRHPESGDLYVNEARGPNKADIFLLEAGANYMHQGATIGTPRTAWANASGPGGKLITGGVWYPHEDSLSHGFPAEYHGLYFTPLWGSNRGEAGNITYIQPGAAPQAVAFLQEVGEVDAQGIPLKPVLLRVGPEGALYFLLTTYETKEGAVHRILVESQETVARPVFVPNGGTFTNPVTITLVSDTPGATIRYTRDGSDPDQASQIYDGPFLLTESSVVRTNAFKVGLVASSVTAASFRIGEVQVNLPPVVDAGPDQEAVVGEQVFLDGSASYDPDGENLYLTGERWVQLGGPPADLVEGDDEQAWFIPTHSGAYLFQLTISDGHSEGADEMSVQVYLPPNATPAPGTPVPTVTRIPTQTPTVTVIPSTPVLTPTPTPTATVTPQVPDNHEQGGQVYLPVIRQQ